MIKPKTMVYYDLLALAETMENNGYMSKDMFIDTYITSLGYGNDSYFYFDFDHLEYDDDTMEKRDYENYCKGVKKLLNLPDDREGIMVNFCW